MADATKDASLNRRAFKAGIFYIARYHLPDDTCVHPAALTGAVQSVQNFRVLASDLRTGHVALPVAKRRMCQV